VEYKMKKVAKSSFIRNVKFFLRIFLKARRIIIKLKLENKVLKNRIAELTYKNIYDLEGFQSHKKLYKNYVNKLN